MIVRRDSSPCARISFSVRGSGLTIDLDGGSDVECDQEIIVPEPIWLESLGGNILRRDLFNLCLNRQLKPFTQSVAALRYFITYYFDFGDISPWARISDRNPRRDVFEQMRVWRDVLAPKFSEHDLRDEYCEGARRLSPLPAAASDIER